MPATHIVSIAPQIPIYTVNRKGKHEPVNILKEDGERVYVNYINLEKRLDEWVPLGALIPIPAPTPNQDASSSSTQDPSNSQNSTATNQAGSKKRKRTPSTSAPSTPTPVPESLPNPQPTQEIEMTEEDYDIQHHQKQIGAVRNFDRVHFGKWNIRTWYYSPYPFSENEEPDGPTRPVVVVLGEEEVVEEGVRWVELGKVCQVKHPPGRKVYQRGAHTIWEVDGAKEKSYSTSSQTLQPEKDHMMGYFCKVPSSSFLLERRADVRTGKSIVRRLQSGVYYHATAVSEAGVWDVDD
ncbi:hypothetical protein VNI00_009128 [Paramarasmius palmivorus]|uniref:Uncharacterized protein n=1 Tax=Paramarasmius palmivorus TaxID=297713 RepID=A0AAW0CRJ0_9AGAR